MSIRTVDQFVLIMLGLCLSYLQENNMWMTITTVDSFGYLSSLFSCIHLNNQRNSQDDCIYKSRNIKQDICSCRNLFYKERSLHNACSKAILHTLAKLLIWFSMINNLSSNTNYLYYRFFCIIEEADNFIIPFSSWTHYSWTGTMKSMGKKTMYGMWIMLTFNH